MKRNRLEIATRLLNDVLTADYETIRQKRIDSITNKWLKWCIDDAHKPVSEYKSKAIKKHFEHHAGHCAECHKPLNNLVLPLDTRVKSKITRLTACVLHTKELKGKTYTAKQCRACDVLFKSYSDSQFCSLACRSWFDYHQRKQSKQTAICKNCDSEFSPKRADSIFCGTNCRVTYWRMAKRQIDLFGWQSYNN